MLSWGVLSNSNVGKLRVRHVLVSRQLGSANRHATHGTRRRPPRQAQKKAAQTSSVASGCTAVQDHDLNVSHRRSRGCAETPEGSSRRKRVATLGSTPRTAAIVPDAP